MYLEIDDDPLAGETLKGLENVSAGVFSEAAQTDQTFHSCLAAVYLAGIKHGYLQRRSEELAEKCGSW